MSIEKQSQKTDTIPKATLVQESSQYQVFRVLTTYEPFIDENIILFIISQCSTKYAKFVSLLDIMERVVAPMNKLHSSQ